MKKGMIVTVAILAIAVFGLTSCEKSDGLNVKDVEGVYEGTFSVSSSLKAASLDGGEEIGTTFLLDYYVHNDSVMVCLTGEDYP